MATAIVNIPFVDLKTQYRGIRNEITAAMAEVLDSAHYVGGRVVERFENEFAEFVQARHCVGVSSGTSALELALRAAGIGPSDEVIVPSNSFIATAEAVSNVGAVVRFADVDPVTFHLDLESVKSVMTPKVKAIIPVHLYGRAMDLKDLDLFAAENGLIIVEDCAQSHGAKSNDVSVGASGRLTCFSFYPGKNLGAYGDAGAVTTNDPQQAETLRMLRDHGSKVKYKHTLVGTNARLDAIQAAVLSVKLRYLPEWNGLRAAHAACYSKALEGSCVKTPDPGAAGEHVYHLYVVRSDRRDELQRFLETQGISTGIHYPVPLHLTEAYQARGAVGPGSLPVTEKISSEILSLPMFPELTQEQIDHTVTSIRRFERE